MTLKIWTFLWTDRQGFKITALLLIGHASMYSLLNFIGPQFFIYKIKLIPTYPPFGTAVKIKWNNVGKPLDVIPSTKYTLNKRTDGRDGMIVELQTEKVKTSVERWAYGPLKRKTKKAIAKEEKLIWDILHNNFSLS